MDSDGDGINDADDEDDDNDGVDDDGNNDSEVLVPFFNIQHKTSIKRKI